MSTLPSEANRSMYDHVAQLDPLSLDDGLNLLPRLNQRADVQAIVDITHQAVGISELIEEPSQVEAMAVLRDLDFLASSLLRHGHEPTGLIYGLEAQLLKLGRIAHTVPRGTVYTYAIANPTDDRQRTFTGTDEERAFIHAVAEGSAAIEVPVINLGNVALHDSTDLPERLRDCADGLDTMVDSIVEVRRVVTPEFFSYTMRPYFEPLTVGGKQFTGAGGAQMQLLGIDNMLWGIDDADAVYQQYFMENRQYLSEQQLLAIRLFAETNHKSVVSWLREQGDQTANSVSLGVVEVLKRVRKFRFPHRKVAEDNFKLRPDIAVGSGKYRPDILDVLIQKTDDAIKLVEQSHD